MGTVPDRTPSTPCPDMGSATPPSSSPSTTPSAPASARPPSPPAPPSPRPNPDAWPVTRTCCRWCSAPTPPSLTSAAADACSTDTNAWRWPSATKAASSPAATGPRLVRSTPQPILARRRTDRPGQRLPALLLSPPPHPPRPLDRRDGSRRHTRSHPTGPPRPRQTTLPPPAIQTQTRIARRVRPR